MLPIAASCELELSCIFVRRRCQVQAAIEHCEWDVPSTRRNIRTESQISLEAQIHAPGQELERTCSELLIRLDDDTLKTNSSSSTISPKEIRGGENTMQRSAFSFLGTFEMQ